MACVDTYSRSSRYINTHTHTYSLLKWGTNAGPLAGSFPILSLRTNKADVVVGIPQAVADNLDESEEKWRVNGR